MNYNETRVMVAAQLMTGMVSTLSNGTDESIKENRINTIRNAFNIADMMLSYNINTDDTFID